MRADKTLEERFYQISVSKPDPLGLGTMTEETEIPLFLYH